MPAGPSVHSLPRGLAEVGKDLLLGSSFARQVRIIRSPQVCWTDASTGLLELLHEHRRYPLGCIPDAGVKSQTLVLGLDVCGEPTPLARPLTFCRKQLLENDPGLNQSLISSATTISQLFDQNLWEKHRRPGRYVNNLANMGQSTVRGEPGFRHPAAWGQPQEGSYVSHQYTSE